MGKKNAALNRAFLLAILILLGMSISLDRQQSEMSESDQREFHSQEVLQAYNLLLSDVKNAECGQRGYLITGDPNYLQPYHFGIEGVPIHLHQLKDLTQGAPQQQRRLAEIEALLPAKLSELSRSIDLRAKQGFEAASHLVATNEGKILMDQIRELAWQSRQEEAASLEGHTESKLQSRLKTFRLIAAQGLAGFGLLAGAFLLLKREQKATRVSEEHYRRKFKSAKEELLRGSKDFELMINAVQDYAIFMLDGEGRVSSWNCGAERIKGWSAEEVQGMHFSMFFPPEQADAGTPQFALEMARRNGVYAEEFQRLRKDGSVYLAEVTLTALKDENGTVRGFAEVSRDITERCRLEREVLQVSENEQKRLGQDLHDDLGQQLAGLRMLTGLLTKALRKQENDQWSKAELISDELGKTIEAARNLAKGLYPIELVRGGLPTAIQDLCLRTSSLTKIRCESRVDEGFRIEEDKAIHLYRIIQEAVSNAIKHGKPKSIQVDCLSSDGVASRVIIRDDGVGFVRPSPGAVGMGLHLFDYRARMVGASIQVEKGREGGCVVTCSLGGVPQPLLAV